MISSNIALVKKLETQAIQELLLECELCLLLRTRLDNKERVLLKNKIEKLLKLIG